MGLSRELLRVQADRHGPGRLARLERTLLALHGLLLATFTTFTLLPLLTPHRITATEVAVRGLVTVVNVGVMVDLQVHGERLWHLLLVTVDVCVVSLLAATRVPGDVAGGLAVSAFALSAVRLLRPRAYAAALLAVGLFFVGGRALVGEPGVGSAAFDDFVLATAMTFAAAIFIDSVQASTRETVRTDERAALREAELAHGRAEAQAREAARRVLHDDVLTALRAVAEAAATTGPDRDRSRATARAECVAAARSVRQVLERT